MYTIWSYFYSEPTKVDEKPRIRFGKWASQLDYLDYHYHQLATRLIKFTQETGQDPYDRYFDLEPLVDFAIDAGITEKSVDYIYRHYVYHLLSKHETIDIDREELSYLYGEFLLVPEDIRVCYDKRIIPADSKN